MSATRGQLGFRWGSFVFLWCGAVLLVRDAVNFLACSAENLELEEGSPKELYSGGTRDYMNWGEPPKLTTPLPYLPPLAVLAALGGYGKRFLKRAALFAAAALVLHVLCSSHYPAESTAGRSARRYSTL